MKTIASLCSLIVCSFAFAQSPITSIPFELFGDHMLIKVSVDNSEPLDFIFDTGSGLTVIDSDVAEGLKLSGKKIKMNEATTTVELIKHNEIEIDGFPMEKNIKVYATDLDHLEISLGRDIDGIVGYDLMHHHTIRINYENKTMDIYEHGKGPKSGDAVPFVLNTSIPTISGKVVLNNKEPHTGTFFIMSGAGTTLDFNSPYAQKYDVIHKTGKHYSYVVKGITEEETLHYEGHVLSLSFGNQVIKDLPIGISQANHGIQASPEVSGIIGNKILSMYNITIDVPSKMLYFEKNANFGQKLSVNCSGIDLQLTPDKKRVLIHQVFEDSPASDAGIKLNDELITINDKSVAEFDLPDIKDLLKKEGETVNLVIKQDGQEKSVSLTLRSLID
ncbi:aspartyl protease family protein [Marinoscillum sp. 108]|uniref:aspartyl protease family protein n=1 Tax=Marinoscillum sp. 108 TaxID=2653151 RepID=UPI0013567465|nr:aspartyl protease family protein [Marinoscillum sp. 108]